MPTLQELQDAYARMGVPIPGTPNIDPQVMAAAYGNIAQAQQAFTNAGQRAPIQQGFINTRAGIDYGDLQGNYGLRNNYLTQTYGNQAGQLAGQRDFTVDQANDYYGYNTGRTNALTDFELASLQRQFGDTSYGLGRQLGDTQYGLGRNWEDTQANLAAMLGVTQSGEAGQLAAANAAAAAREQAAQREYANHTAMLALQRQQEVEKLYSSALARGFGNSGINDVTKQRFETGYAQQGTELSNAQQAVMDAMAAQRQGNQASNDYALARAQAQYAAGMRNGLTDYDVGMRTSQTGYDLGMRNAQTGLDLGSQNANLQRDLDVARFGLDRNYTVRGANQNYGYALNDLNTNNAYQVGLNNQNYITGAANIGLAQTQGLTNLGWNLADAGQQAQLTATNAYLQMLASAGR